MINLMTTTNNVRSFKYRLPLAIAVESDVVGFGSMGGGTDGNFRHRREVIVVLYLCSE
jgi:hypothetical protein